jgi:hypothetical protein
MVARKIQVMLEMCTALNNSHHGGTLLITLNLDEKNGMALPTSLMQILEHILNVLNYFQPTCIEEANSIGLVSKG